MDGAVQLPEEIVMVPESLHGVAPAIDAVMLQL